MAGSNSWGWGGRWLAACVFAGLFPVSAWADSDLAPETSILPKPRPAVTVQTDQSPETGKGAVTDNASLPDTTKTPAGLSGLAYLAGEGVALTDRWRGVAIEVPMTQAVPWRVFTLDNPKRLVIDFSELDWQGIDIPTLLSQGDWFSDIRAGLYRPGWTRIVFGLSAPYQVVSAGLQTQDQTAGSSAQRVEAARLRIELTTGSDADFAAAAGAPKDALFDRPARPMPSPKTRQRGFGDITVVLDPGHGGIDPGAERGGAVEAHLMMSFARELKEELLRAGGFNVVLTRDADEFVPLEERVTIARRAGADVFLSLHADALAQGRATGASVYTLSQDASDEASRKLAERHDRSDILAGVDLSQQDDAVALVLMDLARTDTAPRSEALADSLVEGIHSATGSTYKTPRLQAGFSVLKAADIPSVLIELGFLSSERDRERLTSREWRADAARGIREALQYWVLQDAGKADLLRQ
ncbi:N-acetylmuramoyl-L-alanine amidase [Aliiroseovarius sp. F20344]|uniref:N-acetylmuramoyl-L-alanine amidase n=1 Tax=Aliiroseovarius sp. F20344 TaxID=2926414 RepID=UPI001FF3F940|nr:N-acetylmuramoyl-L-alanine amidase [Aliiroseovarius sp. F20344]MCK0143453.1 N-acetylmuramoyl-L-alanine amidase [Aliiroseovarius sp. F20344]